MYECACDYDECDEPSVFQAKTVKARKYHACVECHEPIEPGERHEVASGLWDGKWLRHRTCLACVAIGRDFCCGRWQIGELAETIMETNGLTLTGVLG
jgi:hypothetical protein